MTVVAGKTLLFLACLWLGLDRGRRRRARTDCLRAFRQALADLGRELAFSLQPLDKLMDRPDEGPTGTFFRSCRACYDASGGESWAESWKAALERADLPVRATDRPLLARAGEILGRWDGETQQKALSEVLAQLDEAVFDSREEAKRLFRADLALGAAAGGILILML